MCSKLKFLKHLATLGIVVNTALIYKTHQKYSKLKASLDKFVWLSQETLMPSLEDFDYDLMGVAFSDVSLDLTDALSDGQANIDIISDYSQIKIKVKKGTHIKLNGDSKYSRAVIRPVDAVNYAEDMGCSLEINYSLLCSNLVIEVLP